MRGGTVLIRTVNFLPLGLSPRARGNPDCRQWSLSDSGTIPACAGEPSRSLVGRWRDWDYPRVRGGTSRTAALDCYNSGLSPRARGNRVRPQVEDADPGTIPACAGEPSSSVVRSRWQRDYPRVRGGTRSARSRAVLSSGLSPRARGNRSTSHRAGCGIGTIPACAGEPLSPCRLVAILRDYPRVRGGTGFGSGPRDPVMGLSPRARGNLLHSLDDTQISGTIPACAGEPGNRSAWKPSDWDYPRVRGGTFVQRISRGLDEGLSPRARGNPKVDDAEPLASGTIPACAGEPITMPRTC